MSHITTTLTAELQTFTMNSETSLGLTTDLITYSLNLRKKSEKMFYRNPPALLKADRVAIDRLPDLFPTYSLTRLGNKTVIVAHTLSLAPHRANPIPSPPHCPTPHPQATFHDLYVWAAHTPSPSALPPLPLTSYRTRTHARTGDLDI